MLTSLPRVLALFQVAAMGQTPDDPSCESARIEWRRDSSASPREVCVSPGLVTSLVFDVPMSVVDLQGEVEFEEVIRSPRLLSFIPPRQMQPGERLRLTVGLEGDATQRLSFTLVARRGQATHQVQVFHDPRSTESLRQECEQERERSRRLMQDNGRLRARIQRTRGLSLLLSSRNMRLDGVAVQMQAVTALGESDGELVVYRGTTYRTATSIAVRLWMMNHGSDPWLLAGVSLANERGEEYDGVQWLQSEPLKPQNSGFIVVEVDALASVKPGPLTLKLWDEHSRSITLPQLTFP